MAYIYRHIRLDKNEPFYIGRSSTDDGYKRSREWHNRNTLWNRVVAKTDYEIEIMMDDLSEEESVKKEMEFIELYGRKDAGTGILCNMSDGGDGFRDQYRSLKHEDQFEDWFRMYEEGWTVSEISRETGVPSSTIGKQIQIKFGKWRQDPWMNIERHMNKGSDDECWNWSGSMATYPEVVIGGEVINIAKYTYERKFGVCDYPILRVCKNKKCVNPHHMKPRMKKL